MVSYRFLRSEEGTAFVFLALTLPVLMGFTLLAVDVGRGNNLHYDAQKAADALALAGARELNGQSDALTRAQSAISNLVQNQERLNTGGPSIVAAATQTCNATQPG